MSPKAHRWLASWPLALSRLRGRPLHRFPRADGRLIGTGLTSLLLAEQVTEEDLAIGLIYPPQSHILDASLHVAERIASCIFDKGLAGVPRPDDVGVLIRARVYRPLYPE
jgi:hypothetical protein